MTPALTALLADPARMGEVPARALPAVLGELAALQLALVARMAEGTAEQEAHAPAEPDTGQLLTPEEAAELLSIPRSRVYAMARRGEIPNVKVGKYVRLPVAGLRAWIAGKLKKPIDSKIYKMYNKGHERKGTQASPHPPRAHPGGARGASFRHPQHGGPLGAGRSEHQTGDGKAHSIGGGGGTGATERPQEDEG